MVTASGIRVLFLTRYPREGASSRYRVFQYLPHLEALGIHCTVQSFMDHRLYQLSFKPGKIVVKVWHTAQAVLSRLSALWWWQHYDIIYMQRELLPFGPPLIERWMARRGAVLIFDYDDALFIKKPSRYNPIATFFRSPGKITEIMGLVDCVVAGNEWLAESARRMSAKTAVTVEVAEDTERISMRPSHTNAKPVTVGWLGSSSTVKYLRLIEPVLQRIANEHPDLRWEIMGGGDFQMDGVPWVLSDWSLAGELEALSRFDIGLMPLPSEDWAKGKSGGKARTYMAAGVVPICAKIGYNLELLRDGVTGFLCQDDQDWYGAITEMIADAAARQQIAEAARADVEARFSPVSQASKLANLFIETLGDRRADR